VARATWRLTPPRTLDPWRERWGQITNDAARSKEVLQFYAYKILAPRHRGVLATIEITDGPKDGGLDGYLQDDGKKSVVLLQCQWLDSEGKTLSKSDARKLLSFYNDHLLKDNDAGLKPDVAKFVKKWNSFLKGYKTTKWGHQTCRRCCLPYRRLDCGEQSKAGERTARNAGRA